MSKIVSVKAPSDETIISVEMKNDKLRVVATVKWRQMFVSFKILLFFISFVIPKYNNYNYYNKTYMHKRTTHLSTHAIPQSHTRYAYCYITSAKLIILVKEEN